MDRKSKITGGFSEPFEDFEQQCVEVLNAFDASTHYLRKARNTLKEIEYNGRLAVVKAFKVPTFPQSYGYGLFSRSKAQKSFENAHKLQDLEFHTPKPIGYFETRQSGKLCTSYYICELAQESKTLHEIMNNQEEVPLGLIDSFAEYCNALHQKGVLHRDFNPKNILVSQEQGRWIFALVDINRITWFHKLSLGKAMESLSRLSFPQEIQNQFLEHYASCGSSDLELCKKYLQRSIWKTQRYFRNKRRLRKIFPRK